MKHSTSMYDLHFITNDLRDSGFSLSVRRTELLIMKLFSERLGLSRLARI